MSAFLFASSLKLRVLEGGDKLFVQQHAYHGPAPHPESVADATVVTGKLLLPPLGAQCRDGISPRCLLLASPPVQPLSVFQCLLSISTFFPSLFSPVPNFLSPSRVFVHLPFHHSVTLLPSLMAHRKPRLLMPSPGLWSCSAFLMHSRFPGLSCLPL